MKQIANKYKRVKFLISCIWCSSLRIFHLQFQNILAMIWFLIHYSKLHVTPPPSSQLTDPFCSELTAPTWQYWAFATHNNSTQSTSWDHPIPQMYYMSMYSKCGASWRVFQTDRIYHLCIRFITSPSNLLRSNESKWVGLSGSMHY